MNPVQYQAMPPPQQWGPSIPAQSPPQQWGPSIPAQSPPQQWGPLIPVQPPPQQCGQSIPAKPPPTSFWNHLNIQHHLRDLQETLCLANSLQKELEMLMKVKEAKGYMGKRDDVVNGSTGSLKFDDFSNHFEDNKIDLGAQELIAVEAVNGLMSKIRFLLEPFRIVTDDGSPWEEKSAVVRLRDKINKSKRNKLWRKKKRRRVAELLAQDGEKYEKLNRVADEWRAREIAKDMAQQKVEKMKEIAKQKAKEERKKLEAERELALMVEKLQELRSIRIQKLKKQGHFLPEEDDKFLERVRAAAEEEERQAKAAADTDAAKDAIAAAEESRIVTQGSKLDLKDENHKEDGEESQTRNNLGSLASTSKEFEKQGCDGQSYGTYDYVANLPPEFYHYYHGSNADMGTLIEVRRTWDAYIRPGGSRIPSHWVQPPPPADEKGDDFSANRESNLCSNKETASKVECGGSGGESDGVGLRLAKQAAWQEIILETDGQVVVQRITRGARYLTELDGIINDVLMLRKNFHNVSWSFVKRDDNILAHNLARFTAQNVQRVWLNDVPSELSYVLMDRLTINK